MSGIENNYQENSRFIIVKKRRIAPVLRGFSGWKIAYADFMTAMMAFFLLMWLVKSADEKTKIEIASYFNSIELSDERMETGKGFGLKGLFENNQDPFKNKVVSRENQLEEEGKGEFDVGLGIDKNVQDIRQHTDSLSDQEKEHNKAFRASEPAEREVYIDPFEPDFWARQMNINSSGNALENDQSVKKFEGTDIQNIVKDGIKSDENNAPESQEPAPLSEGDSHDNPRLKGERRAQELKEAIDKQLSGLVGKLAEGLVVMAIDDGFLLSLSDQNDAPMFDVGSSMPLKTTVLIMENIGKVLAERGGEIIIRGHTDSRLFRSGTGDNWRLSFDRAYSAYQMLINGGFDEKRVLQISGFANRQLKVPSDPMNGANRRIEILIREKD